MFYHHLIMKKAENGFTLTELTLVMAILIAGTTLSLPILTRNIHQAPVDRYTQNLESGLFSLRAKLGTSKSSCTLKFPTANEFTEPWKVVEFKQPDGTTSGLNRVECCNSTDGCFNNPSYRLTSLEGTPESKEVLVKSQQTEFMMSPPGTSTSESNLTLLIRSTRSNQSNQVNSFGNSRLRTRCLEVSGSGSILRGTWDSQQGRCIS